MKRVILLGQDTDAEVRVHMSQTLGRIIPTARWIQSSIYAKSKKDSEEYKEPLLKELIQLTDDDEILVRDAAFETFAECIVLFDCCMSIFIIYLFVSFLAQKKELILPQCLRLFGEGREADTTHLAKNFGKMIFGLKGAQIIF